jgi:hypothetical protein
VGQTFLSAVEKVGRTFLSAREYANNRVVGAIFDTMWGRQSYCRPFLFVFIRVHLWFLILPFHFRVYVVHLLLKSQ